MFIASVAFCAVFQGTIDTSNCVHFGDSYGPYETEEQCNQRSLEMKESIQSSHLIAQEIIRRLGTYNAVGVNYCYEETPPGELM